MLPLFGLGQQRFDQLAVNGLLQRAGTLGRQRAQLGIDAAQEFDRVGIQRAALQPEAFDKFRERLPLPFVGRVVADANQALGDLAQGVDGFRSVFALENGQQHLLIGAANLAYLGVAVDIGKALDRRV